MTFVAGQAQRRALAFGSYSFVLPPGWEITAYLAAVADGELHFHDREQLVGQLRWGTIATAPDQAQLMRRLDDRAREAGGSSAVEGADGMTAPQLREVQHGAWHLGYRDDQLRYASLYQEEAQRLLTWRFPAGAHEAALLELLSSYASNSGPRRTWRMFGIDLQLPQSFAYAELRADAADVTMRWHGPQCRTVVARCMGMDRALLAQRSLEQLTREALMRQRARVLASEPQSFDGCPAVHTTFLQPPENGVEALLGRPSPGESLIWHNARERRIHALTQWGRDARDALVLRELVNGRANRESASLDVVAHADAAPEGSAGPPNDLGQGGRYVDAEHPLGQHGMAARSPLEVPPSFATPSACPTTPTGTFDRLQALPLRNEHATVQVLADGQARVTVRQAFPRGLERLALLLGAKRHRSFILDHLGSSLFERLSEDRTVQEHVDWLSREHQLTFHEARILIMKYLEVLLSRGLVAIAVPSSALR